MDQAEMDAICEQVRQRFARNPEVRIHRRSSQDLEKIFPLHSLDWIYIDGDHSKNAVYHDVCLSLYIVKPSGMITGDDYYWRDSDGTCPVKDAITELSRERDLEPRILGNQFIIMLS